MKERKISSLRLFCGKKLWLIEIAMVLMWYVLTAIESWLMGVHPLARRAFSVFDSVLFVVLVCTAIFLHLSCRRYRKAKINKDTSG